MIRTLNSDALRWTLAIEEHNDSDLQPAEKDRHGRPGALGQERALMALELGLGIRERGFNIFVVGASGTGRTSTVRELLAERARVEPTPQDVILLYNFEDRDRPLALFVPPGRGPAVKKRYDALVEKLLVDLEKAFESDSYIERRNQLDQQHQQHLDEQLKDIDAAAVERGFILSRTGAALTLAVADENGAPVSEEAYEKISAQRREELEKKAEELQGGLEDALRRIRALEKTTDEALEKLARETADAVIKPLIDEVKAEMADMPAVQAHLEEVRKDILERLRRLAPESHAVDDGGEAGEAESQPVQRRLSEEEDDSDRDEPALLRYRVNVIVTHAQKAGAPVVMETHPTASNLIGRIEHRVRGGETQTDFTRIKGGALFRANGGYLLLHAQDLLRDPAAWEGLKRALKNRQIELDDPGEPGRMVTVASLRPEPVPLALKICLIGTPELYYMLSRTDPDFSKLFKVKVDFDVEMDRSKERLQHYMRFLSGLAHEEQLTPLSLDGAARVLEHAARVCDDQEKLTTRFGEMADLVREASFWATKAGHTLITRAHVRRALLARAEREGFIELRMREDILRRRISIHTEGSVTGQVNGLTVMDLGSYAFGMPVRITCKTGAGKGEMTDIERETELGGPLHTKGTLILRGILLDRFGDRVPLRIHSTICMEQSYSDIDGDSASLAESCALFSSLADAPMRQDIAMTGSIDQLGNVQAVGGVNEKIEGFFRVCKARGDSGKHGVVIPQANARDLMLDEEVVEACAAGEFFVSTVETLEDAIEVMTGCPWRERSAPARSTTLKRADSKRATKKPAPSTAIEPRVFAALERLAAVQAQAQPPRRATNKAPRALPKAATPARRRR